MKIACTALAVSLVASPVLAHAGPHLHPHSVEGWVVGLGVALISAACALAAKARP